MTEEELAEALSGLIEKGLVAVEYDESLNAHFMLTEAGKQVTEFLPK